MPTLGLTSWQPGADSLEVQHFSDDEHPQLNGRPLRLEPYERAYAVDVRRNRVLLGTLSHLRLFSADAQQVWSSRVPVAWRVAQSPDGRLIVAALEDGTVRWFRALDGVELLAFFLDADGRRWVAFTPGGYYAAGPGGEDLIGWQVNNGPDRAADFFPASRYRERFYRPDVVSLVLKTLNESEAVQRAQKVHAGEAGTAPDVAKLAAELQQAVLDDRPPVVNILSPLPGTQLTGDQAELQVEVRSPTGRPITRTEVRLNARPVQAEVSGPQPTLAVGGGLAERRRIVVPVPAGQPATLHVIAWSGERASEAASLEVEGGKPTLQPKTPVATTVSKPRLNAVLIGVSAYRDPNLKLNYAAKDAQDVAAALIKQKGGLYGEVNIESPLVDDQATKQAILDALATLKNQGSRYDTTIVFMAGHGKAEGDSYFFLAFDADQDNFASRGVTASEIKDLLRDVNGHVLLFVDTCYAGRLVGGRAVEEPMDLTPLINELKASDAGLIVYGASQRGERSQEVDGNGAFTRALLDILAGKDGHDSDGAIHVNTLESDLSVDVPRLASGQHPSFGAPDGAGDPPIFIPR